MSIEGLWSSELLGILGWESIGVVVLNDGKAIGGGANHHSTGAYDLKGEILSISMDIIFHGAPRTLFGESGSEYSLTGSLKLNKNTFQGTVRRVDTPKQKSIFKLTKLAELP